MLSACFTGLKLNLSAASDSVFGHYLSGLICQPVHLDPTTPDHSFLPGHPLVLPQDFKKCQKTRSHWYILYNG